jgi:hypothetical protein
MPSGGQCQQAFSVGLLMQVSVSSPSFLRPKNPALAWPTVRPAQLDADLHLDEESLLDVLDGLNRKERRLLDSWGS